MNKIKQLVLVLVAISLTIALPKVKVFSSNKTIIQGNGKIQIAKPILELQKESENEVFIDEKTKNLDYYFKIVNYNSDDEVCQMQQKYTLKVTTQKAETINHIKYTLYSTNANNTTENIVDIENNETNEITIDGGTKKDDYYRLNIEYVDTNSNINDEILICLKNISMNLAM